LSAGKTEHSTKTMFLGRQKSMIFERFPAGKKRRSFCVAENSFAAVIFD
jgi:hypothetical protein